MADQHDHPLPLDDWQDRSACKGSDPSLFFPSPHIKVGPDHPAMQLCAACSVRDRCLDDALSYSKEADHGIRGGLTEAARFRLRRGRPPARRQSRDVILDLLGDGEWWTVRQVVRRVDVSKHTVHQMLQLLSREGLVESMPDPNFTGRRGSCPKVYRRAL